jgi:sulfate adenylyltransferase subunit 1 (EFTu-like GTPase family)
MTPGLKAAGTSGQKIPVEASSSNWMSLTSQEMMWSEGELLIETMSRQEACEAAMAAKSIATGLEIGWLGRRLELCSSAAQNMAVVKG